MKTLACIGCGAMGSAILKGLAHGPLRLLAHDKTPAKVQSLAPEGVEWAKSQEEAAKQADYLLLAVKPHHIVPLLETIKPVLRAEQIIISIAAAVDMATLKAAVSGACPVVRLMPNLPVKVGKGVLPFCVEDLPADLARELLAVFAPVGLAVALPEDKFAAVTALSGCGPAFVCLFMEGMVNAGVALGLSHTDAAHIVAATFEGTAALVQQNGLSMADTRAQVCSPAGVTIAAINHMEKNAIRGLITEGTLTAAARDKAMGKGEK